MRQTKSGIAADLIISVGGVAAKYNVYLRDDAIELLFRSTDWSRVELAARLLKLAGVDAEMKKEGGRDRWYIEVTTDKLAAGHEKLRKALAEIIREARVDEKKAKRWLEKLEKGRILKEGWPKYHVRLTRSGALEIQFSSTNPDSIKQAAQQLREMGLEEGKHFSIKMPEGGEAGYVYIRREGLAYAAWLSVHGKDKDQRELAADFVKIILQRAEKACGGVEPCAIYEKAKEIIEEGRSWGSLTLEGFEKKVEVNGKTYVVKVIDGEAFEEDRGGRKLLRIRITAEVDGVRSDFTITYGRYGKLNAAVGRAYAGTDVDAERLAAVIEALTGVKPKVYRRSDGTIELVCGKAHLDGFKRFAELADAVEKWLEETSR